MKKYLIALSLVGLVTTSCYEKLNIAPPNNITNEMVQELLKTADEATIQTIMGAMADVLPNQLHGGGYSGFNNNYEYNYQGQDVMRDFTGNDIAVGNTPPGGDIGNFYNGTNLRGAEVNSQAAWWTRGYAMIQNANKVMNMISEETIKLNPNSKTLKEYLGRAYLVRAYGYEYLMESYATDALAVPIYTLYTLGQPLQARAATSVANDSILKWAKRSVELLNLAGVGYAKNKTGVINEGVANFVLARAALYAKDWATVITACDKLIANYPTLMNANQYVGRDEPGTSGQKFVYWAKNSGFFSIDQNPETILGWDNGNKSYNTAVYWMNFMYSGQQARIDDRLYNKIDNNDFRKANFQVAAVGAYNTPGTGSFTDGDVYNIGSYINFKFACSIGIGGSVGNTTATNVSVTDFIQFRVAEAYLMKAEAQAQSGDGNGAKATLNLLLAARTKAGSPTLTCDNYAGMAGLTPLQMVQLQTRIEMWGERGLEWYNNRRWGIPVNRAGSTVHHNPAMTYSVADMTLQIPMMEINTNNNIVQTP